MSAWRVMLILSVTSTIAFSYWFAFVYQANRHPNSDVIGAISMGLFLGCCFWGLVGAIVELWNLGKEDKP